MSSSDLYVDTRIRGDYGIGRLSTEILTRLTLPYRTFAPDAEPLSARDAVTARRLSIPSSSWLYTPGFNAGLARCQQLVTLCDLIHLQQDAEPSRQRLWRSYYQFVVRPAVRRAQHVITISAASADDIREWLQDDSVTIHNFGIGLSSAFTQDCTEPTDREDFYLFVGNSKPHKNLAVVLRALQRMPNARLVAVVPDHPACGEMVAQHGLHERVSLRRGLSDDELASLYRRCRALVYPSLIEGFGLPVAEALACGAVVLYYAGCASVVEIAGLAGTPIATLDPADWAEAMAQTGAAAIPDTNNYALRYSWDRTAVGIQALLTDLIA